MKRSARKRTYYILEAELEETNNEVGLVGDEYDDNENDVDAKKCKQGSCTS